MTTGRINQIAITSHRRVLPERDDTAVSVAFSYTTPKEVVPTVGAFSMQTNGELVSRSTDSSLPVDRATLAVVAHPWTLRPGVDRERSRRADRVGAGCDVLDATDALLRTHNHAVCTRCLSERHPRCALAPTDLSLLTAEPRLHGRVRIVPNIQAPVGTHFSHSVRVQRQSIRSHDDVRTSRRHLARSTTDPTYGSAYYYSHRGTSLIARRSTPSSPFARIQTAELGEVVSNSRSFFA